MPIFSFAFRNVSVVENHGWNKEKYFLQNVLILMAKSLQTSWAQCQYQCKNQKNAAAINVDKYSMLCQLIII